jgi:hypothetical protein
MVDLDLNPALPLAGIVIVTAQDTASRTVKVPANFGLAKVLGGEDNIAFSSDGLVEL